MISDATLSRTVILETAAGFRLGREAESNEQLVGLIDILGQHLHILPEAALKELASIMQQTFDAQARQDYIGVADGLEYEILPGLLPLGLLID